MLSTARGVLKRSLECERNRALSSDSVGPSNTVSIGSSGSELQSPVGNMSKHGEINGLCSVVLLCAGNPN